LVRTLTDEENMLLAIIENMQREDLNPIEEAEGLEKMIKVYGFTQDKVSKSVSKSRPYITNALRLLNLPESVRKEVAEGRLSAGHARAILSADNFQKQEELCKRVIAEGLSVRETEKLASTEKQKRNKALKRVKPKEILSVENELKDIYGTKVNIEAKGKGGSIQLHYYSMDELNRLIDILRVANINS
ncbi:MAG: ParB/RepB/Spo0J family partition protein, partial [[Eubacterium] sulci]|nr:ParB/RepB/Spo0J family partition protein [[Eubacterium] sulci]